MALTPQFINPHGQGSKTVSPQPMIASGDQQVAGSAGGAATLTVTGQAGRRIMVRQIAWSYTDTPAAGSLISLKDSDGSPVTYFEMSVTSSGMSGWSFSPTIGLPVGLNAVITLSAPGGAVVGRVFVNAYVEQ